MCCVQGWNSTVSEGISPKAVLSTADLEEHESCSPIVVMLKMSCQLRFQCLSTAKIYFTYSDDKTLMHPLGTSIVEWNQLRQQWWTLGIWRTASLTAMLTCAQLFIIAWTLMSANSAYYEKHNLNGKNSKICIAYKHLFHFIVLVLLHINSQIKTDYSTQRVTFIICLDVHV